MAVGTDTARSIAAMSAVFKRVVDGEASQHPGEAAQHLGEPDPARRPLRRAIPTK